MSVNMMIAMGHLTMDPELRYTPTGTAVAEASVALNRTWIGNDGEKKEEVTFMPFAAFGKTAETISQYFQKGALIHLTGYVKQENWEDKQTGQKRSRMKLIVDRFSFCGSTAKKEDGERPQPPRRPPAKAAQPAQPVEGGSTEEDDVPF